MNKSLKWLPTTIQLAHDHIPEVEQAEEEMEEDEESTAVKFVSFYSFYHANAMTDRQFSVYFMFSMSSV